MNSAARLKNFYRQMVRIRSFEESLLAAFPGGQFYGTTHTYIGQEANAVGVLAWLDDGDVVVSNHRCHGHFLAYGGPMHGLAAELMGRATGVCGGRGGSQHLQWQDFYANGVLGGTLPMAAGMALAEKAWGKGRVVVAFTGDGALGEGAVYESMNMAALWKLPLLIVLENNRYAQSTPIELNLAGGISARLEAFGLPVAELDTTNVELIWGAAGPVFEALRNGQGPQALVLHTYRFAPHSKGDDTRDPEEIARYRRLDPLPLLAARLEAPARKQMEAEAQAEVQAAFKQAEADPAADPGELAQLLEAGA